MGARSKTTSTNNLPELQGRSKVRKKVDTTLCIVMNRNESYWSNCVKTQWQLSANERKKLASGGKQNRACKYFIVYEIRTRAFFTTLRLTADGLDAERACNQRSTKEHRGQIGVHMARNSAKNSAKFCARVEHSGSSRMLVLRNRFWKPGRGQNGRQSRFPLSGALPFTPLLLQTCWTPPA